MGKKVSATAGAMLILLFAVAIVLFAWALWTRFVG